MGTPLGIAVKFWPTPTSTDHKASGSAAYSTESGRHSGTTLTDATARRGRQTQPAWVEALMGFPAGWLDGPPDQGKRSTNGSRRARSTPRQTEAQSSEHSATQLSRKSRKKIGQWVQSIERASND